MNSSREEKYWQSKLDLDVPKAQIPFEFDLTEGNKQGIAPFELDSHQFNTLQAVSGGDPLRLQVIVLAATALLLHKYTGQRFVRFGTPADKNEDQTARLVPLQIEIEAADTFRNVLNSTKTALVDAVFNQNFDFSLLTDQETEDFSLFDVVTTLTNLQGTAIPEEIPVNLKINLTHQAESLNGVIVYNAGKYSFQFIKTIGQNFCHFLTNALENLDLPISEVCLLSGSVLIESGNCEPHNLKKSVVDLFYEAVKNRPARLAVKHDIKALSYQDLDKRSNQLAHYLQSQIDADEANVALYLPNSIETVVAALAVLKAGFTFVPIDTELPAGRVQYILQDVDPALVLTTSALTQSENLQGYAITDLTDTEQLASFPKSRPKTGIDATQTAYIIYTSGTSGKPKGVQITHLSFTNYISWASKQYTDAGAKDACFPLFSSLSFDLTITSLFTPIAAGGSVYIYQADQPEVLLKNILSHNTVGVIKATPSHLRLFIELLKNDEQQLNDRSILHTMIVGGEAFNTTLAREFTSLFPNVTLYNEYGPTEATVGCMVHQYTEKDGCYATVPIGAPVDNVNIALLDEQKQPVPAGAIGELYIGGEALSSGYLNQNSLTQTRFVQIPGSKKEKFYQTGDLARKLSNGEYIYVGRKDSQVKINGYRIELAEIENCALTYEQLDEAAALVETVGANGSKIILFFTASEIVHEEALRAHLSNQLAEYMVPHQLIQTEKIPLTTNGKVDYSRLLKMLDVGTQPAELPETDTQKQIHAIWLTHLGLDQIGINANFYASGGDSIKSLGLMNDINKAFNIKLQVKDLYKLKTIKKLAEHIDATLKDAALETASNGQEAQESQITDELERLKSQILNQL